MKKILLLIMLSVVIFASDQIKPNSKLYEINKLKYETPQGRKIRVPNKTKLIVVAFEMETQKLVNEFLDAKSPSYMPIHHAVYIADISKIPSFAANMFALPKLKKYKHPMYLHFDNKVNDNVPSKEEMLTILYIKNKIIIKISYIKTVKELEEVIGK